MCAHNKGCSLVRKYEPKNLDTAFFIILLKSNWTIGVARGPKASFPKKFLAYLVIVCFERRCTKQNAVSRLNSMIYPKKNFWLWLRNWTEIFEISCSTRREANGSVLSVSKVLLGSASTACTKKCCIVWIKSSPSTSFILPYAIKCNRMYQHIWSFSDFQNVYVHDSEKSKRPGRSASSVFHWRVGHLACCCQFLIH